ncbi:MAG: VanZ family protein [Eubacterium sp.]
MTKKTDKIKYILFIITYVLSCLTISTDQFDGYLSYTTADRLLIKFALVFVFVLIAALINRNQQDRILEFSGIFLNVLLVFFAFDYFVTNISGSSSYYRMWWLSIIYIANSGLYVALSISRNADFYCLSRKFWLSVLPTYMLSFLLVFVRKPNIYFEVNLKLGKGLVSYFDYLAKNFHSSADLLFNFVGNVAFFIPIPFLIKAVFPKLKNSLIFIIGFTVPFFVEGYQYIFRCGSVDIDDIVFNLAGLIIGFICLLLESKMHKNDVNKLTQD